MRRPFALRGASAALWIALLPGAGGCFLCPRPPDLAEYLDTGFRTPEQTFRTFQVGVRGDLAAVEFRCLAVEFLTRHGLSELAYREFRDRWLEENPWIRVGIAKAQVRERRDLGEDRCRLLVGSFGETYEVDLVREPFYQVWSGDELVVDELLPDLEGVLEVDDSPDSGPALVARAPLTPVQLPDVTGRPLSELRAGYEWKIADLRPHEEPVATAHHL